jgi:hypothetical protein
MFSIVYGSGPLTPKFLQLRLDIVNSVSRGRLGGVLGGVATALCRRARLATNLKRLDTARRLQHL